MANSPSHRTTLITELLSSNDDELEVRHSDIHGIGTFARRGMQPAHVVGIYEGRRYAPTEENDRPWNHGLTYVFGLSDGTLIDGAEGGNATRHINHSCAPNCQACEEADDDGQLHIVIRTRRRIRAGEELFIDYRLDVGGADPADYVCRCGAAACRGTMAAAVVVAA
jgi:SET domain-containing protein